MLLERMGETVTLEPADGSEPVSVPHVLCAEADVSDQTVMDVQTKFINQARYKGDSVTLSVTWPKSAPHSLMGAHLVIRGERFRIYGEPFPIAHSPNGYDCRITATRSLFLYDVELLRPTAATYDEWGKPSFKLVPTHAKANLLRLSETKETEAAQRDLARLVMLELPPDTWDESYVAFRFRGMTHHVESVERAEDVVVIAGTREVTDDGRG